MFTTAPQGLGRNVCWTAGKGRKERASAEKMSVCKCYREVWAAKIAFLGKGLLTDGTDSLDVTVGIWKEEEVSWETVPATGCRCEPLGTVSCLVLQATLSTFGHATHTSSCYA